MSDPAQVADIINSLSNRSLYVATGTIPKAGLSTGAVGLAFREPPLSPPHTLPVSRGWTLASSLTSFERRAPWRPLPPTSQPTDQRARWWREGSTCSVIRVRTPRLCLSSHSASCHSHSAGITGAPHLQGTSALAAGRAAPRGDSC